MHFTLTSKHLDMLDEQSKLLAYLSGSFTRTSFGIEEGTFILFSKGVQGAIKTSIPIDVVDFTKPLYFQIDYAKWQNALAKQSMSGDVEVDVDGAGLKVKSTSSSDVITLGINTYDIDSSEGFAIRSLIKAARNDISGRERVLEIDDELLNKLAVAQTMFNNNSNNALALTREGITYADRSIILQIKVPGTLETFMRGHSQVLLHKFVVGFLRQAAVFSNTFYFSHDYQKICWLSGLSEAYLVSEACDVEIPTEEDIAAIRPKGVPIAGAVFKQSELLSCLRFFEGFYEASAWKPITFKFKDNNAILYYKHPSTEITKHVEGYVIQDGSFVIASEAIEKLLSKTAAGNGASTDVSFMFDDISEGVSCTIGDTYSIIFAKLVG